MFAVCLVAALLHSSSAPQQDSARSTESLRVNAFVETLARRAIEDGVPALSIAVVRGDEVLCARGFGWADAARAAAATDRTRYAVGSLTRQFTAVAVLLLESSKKLSLEDTLDEHLPSFPTGGRKITLRHLLSNTSGVPGYAALVAKHPEAAESGMSEERFFALFADVPFAFEPGTGFSLDSAGYVLLSMVVAKTSRVSYGAFVTHEILEPLGLEDTRFCPLQDPPVSYARECKLITSTNELEIPLAAAPASATQSLCSSALDLARWSRALLVQSAFGERVTEEMITPAKLLDGSSTDYGFALSASRLHGEELLAHTGGVGGFRVRLAEYRAHDLTIAVLANCDSAPVEAIERELAGILTGHVPPPVLDLPVDAAEAQRLAGAYQLATTRVEIGMRDGSLWFDAAGEDASRLCSQGGGEFVLDRRRDARLRFQIDGARAASFQFSRDGTTSVAVRVD